MDLVDRDRRVALLPPPALADPRPVLPHMARRRRDDRGGARRVLGLLGIGIGLQRQQAAIRADQLVFVEMARAQAGHENLPETAGVPPPHRHAPAVPVVEIADDADPPRVRRPDRERHPLDALMHDRVRAELLIAREMVALDQQMQVEFAEHRPEAVDVVEFLLVPAPPDAQPVAEQLAAVRHAGDEQPGGMDALGARGDLAGRAFDDRDALGVGQKRADVNARPSFDACRERRTDRRGGH